MLIVAFIAIFLVFYLNKLSIIHSLQIAFVGSIGATITKAISIKGYDTVTVPFVASILIYIML